MGETVFTLREPEARFRQEAWAALLRVAVPTALALAAIWALRWQHLPPAYTTGILLVCLPWLLYMQLGPIWADRRLWRSRAGRDLVIGADGVELPAYVLPSYGMNHRHASRQPHGALRLPWDEFLEAEREGDLLTLRTYPDDGPFVEPLRIRLDVLDAPPEAVLAALRR